MNVEKKMRLFSKHGEDSVIDVASASQDHSHGGADRNLCAALVISSCMALPEDAELTALLMDAEDSISGH
jgi:hypothetical protein